MSTTRTRYGSTRKIVAVLIVLAFSTFTFAALAADQTRKIRRLGNPVTAFSKEVADTQEKLQSQFVQYRSDLEQVLEDAGWGGNPQDLFDAVAAGKASRVMVPVDKVLPWMAFRKGGKPTVGANLEWAGKEPFDAWTLKFESNDAVHTFLIPVACLNLAYIKQGPPYPAPSCELQTNAGDAMAAACGELEPITLTGTTDGASMEITGVRAPDGGGNPGQAKSAGSNRWTYAPSSADRYQFTATARSEHGKTATCDASAEVQPAKPCVECRMSASWDDASKLITFDASASGGTAEITGITTWDGSPGDLGDLVAAGPNRWTYAPSVPKKRGAYRFEFAAKATGDGATENCDPVSIEVPGHHGWPREHPEADAPDGGAPLDNAWILRLFGVSIDGDDRAFTSRNRPDGSKERNHWLAEMDEGFGANIERLFSPRMGLELGLLLADSDAELMRDIDEAWETAEDNLGGTTISLSLNFHLTPDSRVDFYLGPVIALVMFDDVTWNVLGATVRADPGDEFAIGAQLGIDVLAASRWAFTAGVRYLDIQAEFSEDTELDVDPLIFMAGVAYRF